MIRLLLLLLLHVTAPCLLLNAQEKGKDTSGRTVLTDNLLKNHTDSVVQQAAGFYMSHPNTVGLSIGIYRNGRIATYNYGEVKKGSGVLPGADSYYDIGSVAKTFVTLMLAKAVVEGKMGLDDDIRKYLPGHYPNLAYKGQPVRVRHLASHTSGLPTLSRVYPDYLMDSISRLGPDGLANFFAIYSADSLLRDMHHFRLDSVPGTKYTYNGNAMMVLVLLLERVYGQPFEALVTQHLRQRYGMQDTRIVLPAEGMKRMAQGYNQQHQPQPHINYEGFRAAPAMHSTINDMLKYIKANLNEKDEVMQLAHRPVWANADGSAVGLGWMISQEDGDTCIYHAGQGGGFNTLCKFYPEKKLGFIIIVNDNISQDRVTDLEKRIRAGLD